MMVEGIEQSDDDVARTRLRKRSLLRYVCLSLVAGGFFAVVGPGDRPSFRMVIGFVFVAIFLFGLIRTVLEVTGLQTRLPGRYRQGIVTSVVVLPVVLLMLQSTGQLTIRDGLVLGGLFGLGIFYVGRLKMRKI